LGHDNLYLHPNVGYLFPPGRPRIVSGLARGYPPFPPHPPGMGREIDFDIDKYSDMNIMDLLDVKA
jgi:hypothetical protein